MTSFYFILCLFLLKFTSYLPFFLLPQQLLHLLRKRKIRANLSDLEGIGKRKGFGGNLIVLLFDLH